MFCDTAGTCRRLKTLAFPKSSFARCWSQCLLNIPSAAVNTSWKVVIASFLFCRGKSWRMVSVFCQPFLRSHFKGNWPCPYQVVCLLCHRVVSTFHSSQRCHQFGRAVGNKVHKQNAACQKNQGGGVTLGDPSLMKKLWSGCFLWYCMASSQVFHWDWTGTGGSVGDAMWFVRG